MSGAASDGEFKLKIKGATIPKLIEKLTPAERAERDNSFITDFMLTYRMFSTPQAFLQALIHRYNGAQPAPCLIFSCALLPVPSAGPEGGASNYPDAEKYERTIAAIQQSVIHVLSRWIEETRDFRDQELRTAALSWLATYDTHCLSSSSSFLLTSSVSLRLEPKPAFYDKLMKQMRTVEHKQQLLRRSESHSFLQEVDHGSRERSLSLPQLSPRSQTRVAFQLKDIDPGAPLTLSVAFYLSLSNLSRLLPRRGCGPAYVD